MYSKRQIESASHEELFTMLRATCEAQRDVVAAISTEFGQMAENLKEARKNIDELTVTVSAQAYEIKKLTAAVDDAKEARENPIAPELPDGLAEAEVMREDDEFDALQAKMLARKQQMLAAPPAQYGWKDGTRPGQRGEPQKRAIIEAAQAHAAERLRKRIGVKCAQCGHVSREESPGGFAVVMCNCANKGAGKGETSIALDPFVFKDATSGKSFNCEASIETREPGGTAQGVCRIADVAKPTQHPAVQPGGEKPQNRSIVEAAHAYHTANAAAGIVPQVRSASILDDPFMVDMLMRYGGANGGDVRTAP